MAAEHFFKNICDSILTANTSSSLPNEVTANNILQRYVETFSKSIEGHLQGKSIRDRISEVLTSNVEYKILSLYILKLSNF